MGDAISTNNLTKKYKDKVVVNHVSLSIRQGELYGLLGVNGAGKTTVINMICGLTKPTSGDIFINGLELQGNIEKVKEIIAVSPQETAIAPNLTVRENLELLARIHGFSKVKTAEKVNEIMALFALKQFEKQKSKTLSGGWKRKLNIALALLTEPKILFLDEPTLGLDILARRELWLIIEQMKSKVTIILTTHYLEEAEALCDRICIMKDGEVKAVGTVGELTTLTKTSKFEEAFIEVVTVGGEAK